MDVPLRAREIGSAFEKHRKLLPIVFRRTLTALQGREIGEEFPEVDTKRWPELNQNYKSTASKAQSERKQFKAFVLIRANDCVRKKLKFARLPQFESLSSRANNALRGVHRGLFVVQLDNPNDLH